MSINIGPGITLGAGVRVDPAPGPVKTGLRLYLDALDYAGSGTTWTAQVGPDATLYAGPTWNNTVGYFDFSPASLQYALAPYIGNLGTWTAECWFKTSANLNTAPATAALTTTYDNGVGTNYGQINYCLGTNNVSGGSSYIKAGYYNAVNAGWHETTGFIPTVGTWYQMVGTFDGTTISTYVNGSLNDTAAGDGPSQANSGPIRIARRWDGPPDDPVNFFPGSIGIVRVYNTALNATQVLQNFNVNCTRFGLAPSLVTSGLILNLDAGNASSYSGTGTTWYDLSGNGNDTTLVGTTPWTDAGNQSYFTFDNAQGVAQGGAIIPNTAYTKIGIFRVAGDYVNLISGDASNQHAFWGAATQYLQSGHNGAWSTIASPVITPTNRWVFGAVTFNTSTGWKLYLNSNTPVTNGDTTPFDANPAVFEVGGFDGNANNLGGDVAAALIYNRALSDAEIAQNFAHYQARFGL